MKPTKLGFPFFSEEKGAIVAATTVTEAELYTLCCGSPCSVATLDLVLEHKSGLMEHS